MRIIRHLRSLPASLRGGAVAIGNFDGLHPGHVSVIEEAGRIAHAAGAPWSVLTFEPHPTSVFRPDGEPFRLTPFRVKAREIAALGVDVMIVMRFDRPFSRRPADEFVRDVLVEGLAARHVVSGYDFVFGHRRQGNCELLLNLGERFGFGFTAVSKLTGSDGQLFSSTAVRDCLRAGDPGGAARILGRPFEIEGRVARGDQRGRVIGYPTANLHLDAYVRPLNGIYAVRSGLRRNGRTSWHDGIASHGIRPMFRRNDPVLEAHLFDHHEDLYGRRLRVALIEYLREELMFDGVRALKAQMALDATRARAVLERTPGPAS